MLLRSLALACAGVLLAALPAAAATTRVNLGDDYFRPGVKTVKKGTRVVWVNVGDDRHTVTAPGYHRVLAPGQRATRRVTKTFRYVCAYHSDMRGRVAVRR